MLANKKSTLAGILATSLMLAGGLSVQAGALGEPLSESTGMYPRVVRVTPGAQVLVATVTNFDGTPHANVFRSSDDGRHFGKVGEVIDPEFKSGLCCGGLYSLSTTVGALPAGTLLYAGSVGQDIKDRPMRLRIYSSKDQGATWTFLSTCHTATADRQAGGLWEAEFAITEAGQLACLFSDETQPGHSQILQESLSKDGINWSVPNPVVQLALPEDRPGMPVVSRLADGRFFMTYEICGPHRNCDVYSRWSPDGVSWGDATDPGTLIRTPNGLNLRATPTNAWMPWSDRSGRLIVTGQRVFKAGVHQSAIGATAFIDDSGEGIGPWRAIPAPVDVRAVPADGNVCQNYSTALLPSADGANVLSLASDYAGRQCRTAFGTTPIPRP